MRLPIRGILPSLSEGLFSGFNSIYVLVLKPQMSLQPISAWDEWLSNNHWFLLSGCSGEKMDIRHWHWSWLYPNQWHKSKNLGIFYIGFWHCLPLQWNWSKKHSFSQRMWFLPGAVALPRCWVYFCWCHIHVPVVDTIFRRRYTNQQFAVWTPEYTIFGFSPCWTFPLLFRLLL